MKTTGWLMVIFGIGLLLMSGCALQADMVDVQLDMDDFKARDRDMERKLLAIEGYLKENSTFSQQHQADLGGRVDQTGIEIQMLQGRLEENQHVVSELGRRMDDQSYRLTELLEKMDSLERRLGSAGFAIPEPAPPPKPEGRGLEGTVLPGRRIIPRELETQETPSPDEASSPGNRVGGLTPTEAYNLAYNDYVRGNYDLALIGFQNFLTQFPTSSLQPSAHYWLGESYFFQKDYPKAVETFETLRQRYPRNDKVPTALLKEGYSFLELGEKRKAKDSLKRVIEQFPFSNEASLAKEKLAVIR
ncbi:MAG TPA: tol-pal system protein YbgF [Nitrospiria bacterium]|jgi:tol-pal system protein YbgF